MILYGSEDERDVLQLEGFNELLTAKHAVDHTLDTLEPTPNTSLSHVARLSIAQENLRRDVWNPKIDRQTSLAQRHEQIQEYEGDEASLILNALSQYGQKHKEVGSIHAENAAFMIDNMDVDINTGDIPKYVAPAEQRANPKRQ